MKRNFTKMMAALALLTFLIPLTGWGQTRAEGDIHEFSQNLQQLLNNNASIPSINIEEQSYPVKKVTISYRYNNTKTDAVTIEVKVDETSWGTFNVNGTGSNYSTVDFEGTSTTGAVVISFTNNTGSGTGHGTFYVNNVILTEGASGGPAPTYTVTLGDDNTTLTQPSAGASVTLPTRDGNGDYSFAGWSETNVEDETTTAPDIILAGDYTPTQNITLYPVYTRTETSSGTINKDASITIASYATANGWVSGNRYTTITMDNNITATGKGNGNNSKYYSTSPGTWRHYAGDAGEITITATSGTLSSVTFTYSGNTLTNDGNNVTSGDSYEVSGTTAVFAVSGTSSNTQVSAISVSYTITGGTTTYYWSWPSTDPVIIASNPEALAFNATGGEFDYSITNPITGVSLNAASNNDWITNVAVDATNSKVTFSTSTNTDYTQRTGAITLSYAGATDKVITITQNAAPTPTITADDVDITCNATSGSIYATITNYVEGVTLQASTEADWITGFSYDQADEIFEVDFTVSQNTDYTPRSATVTLSYDYGGTQPATASVTVTQAAASISQIATLWDKATSNNQTVKVKFTNWYVTATKNSQAYVSDGQYGFVIYQNNHGFSAGDKLNGTVQCQLKMYNGYAQLSGVSASSLTVVNGQNVPVLTTTIGNLINKNYSTVIRIENVTYNGSAFTDNTNTITPYNTFITLPDLQNNARYNIQGVFILYNSTTKEIAPRTESDFDLIPETYTITIASGLENNILTDPEGEVEVGAEVEIAVVPPTDMVLETLTVTKDDNTTVAVSPEVSATITDYTFTMPASDVTISATFVDASSVVTILYSVNGVDTEEVIYDATAYTLPTSISNIPTGFNFAGWTLYEGLPNINILSSYTPQDNDVLVAVFSREEGGVPGDFELVTSSLTDWNGNYLIAYDEYTFADGTIGGKDDDGSIGQHGTSVDLSEYLSNSTIPGEIGELYYVTLESYVDGDNTYYLFMTQDGRYNYHVNNTGNGLSVTSNINTAKQHPITVTFDSNYGDVALTVHGGAIFHYNSNTGTNGDMFRFYKDGGQQKVYFYKQVAGTPGTVKYYTRVFLNETVSAPITITGPSIIPNGSTLNMGDKTLTNATATNLIIEDGAQYIGNSVNATMQKNIMACNYSNNNNAGYNLIASPISGNLTAANVNGLLTTEFDLYKFDNTANLEWLNYKADAFTIDPEVGYLYASGSNTIIEFAGSLNGYEELFEVTIPNAGFNLIGNPFAYNVYVYDVSSEPMNFQVLNSAGQEFTDGSTIKAGDAFLVQTTEANQKLYFNHEQLGKASAVTLNVEKNRGGVIDNARVRFGEGHSMNKFYLNENGTHIFIPQGNEEMAVVYSAAEAEMPVSFKASENGTYTLAVEAENMEMDYLHLIDNMTGADVDLLTTPSYSFEARTTDYTSRFRLVFNANENGASTGSATFAYYNGSEWQISNMGEATLQVVDVMGRIVKSETISGNASVSLNEVPGVYVMRLVNGENVKTQKIVVK